MTRFRLQFHDQPDTNWMMALEGEVEAPTLAKAYESGQDSLGMDLSRETSFFGKRFDRKVWEVEVMTEHGWWQVNECPWCGGDGHGTDDKCHKCDGKGYVSPLE